MSLEIRRLRELRIRCFRLKILRDELRKIKHRLHIMLPKNRFPVLGEVLTIGQSLEGDSGHPESVIILRLSDTDDI
jgi:hypothetical protein